MPIKEVKKQGKVVGYKYGNSGKLYLVSKFGKCKAKKMAEEQMKAMYASGYKNK